MEKKNNSFSPLLAKLMEHPEELIGLLSGMAQLTSSSDTKEETDAPESIAEALPESEDVSQATDDGTVPTGAFEVSTARKRKKREMLCAIKPYIKTEKKAQIDRILQAVELIDLFKKQ